MAAVNLMVGSLLGISLFGKLDITNSLVPLFLIAPSGLLIEIQITNKHRFRVRVEIGTSLRFKTELKVSFMFWVDG